MNGMSDGFLSVAEDFARKYNKHFRQIFILNKVLINPILEMIEQT